MPNQPSRRQVLQSATLGALAWAASPQVSALAADGGQRRKSNDLRIGCIGMRYQGTVIADKARAHGQIVAVCDVDRNVLEQARASFGSTPAIFEDYRDLLSRSDIDAVTIGTPDHWH